MGNGKQGIGKDKQVSGVSSSQSSSTAEQSGKRSTKSEEQGTSQRGSRSNADKSERGNSEGQGTRGQKVKTKDAQEDASRSRRKDTKPTTERGKAEQGEIRHGKLDIDKFGKMTFDQKTKKFSYNNKKEIPKKTPEDHAFEWSEDFKKRQQLNVYDRLMGGGKKK